MVSLRELAIFFLCITLNISNINSGGNHKKSNGWHSVTPPKPNFDPELPQFTPFNSDEFVRIDSDNDDEDVSVNDDEQIHDENNNYYRNNSASENNSKLYPNAHYSSSQSIINNKDVADLQEKLKPLKNLFMGFYQNYKSSYIGNKSTSVASSASSIPATKIEDVENRIEEDDENVEDPPKTNKVKRKKLKKTPTPAEVITVVEDEIKYNVGPGVNLSLDSEKELVSVYLDEDCLKDVFTGRGRKYDLISKILPLFILPFLIQSAIVPFVVTTLKLLLIKSIIVGKIAIFLLIISAFKNHGKYSYDGPPSYYVDPPSRRSEATPIGYRVEGKPTTWIN